MGNAWGRFCDAGCFSMTVVTRRRAVETGMEIGDGNQFAATLASDSGTQVDVGFGVWKP